MARLRSLDDVQFGELIQIELSRPELLNDAGALARYLRVDPGDVGELEDLLRSLAKLQAAIRRMTSGMSAAVLRGTDLSRHFPKMLLGSFRPFR